jgi:hypothetical protein
VTTYYCHFLAVNSLMVCGRLLRVVTIISTISTFRLVMCGREFFAIALVINNVVAAWCNLVNVAYCDDDIKIFD